jgi:P27 family predicted phage terminase small subunit
MRGRKPVPTQLKLLRGNPGRRPLPTQEPTPALVEGSQAPPAWLDKAAKAEWRRVAPLLVKNGLLSELDLDALTAYCVAFTEWRRAAAQARRQTVVVGPNGFLMQSPYVLIAARSLALMRSLMSDFGMTPSARARVTKIQALAPTPPINPLEKFLRR